MNHNVRLRLQRVLPHTVALLAGVGVFQLRTLVLDGESELLEVVYIVVLMAAPYIGAAVVLLLQSHRDVNAKRQVVTPYLWWGGSGAGILLLLTILSQSARGANGFLFWSALVAMVLVPIGVPLLRMLMWSVSPPISAADRTVISSSIDE